MIFRLKNACKSVYFFLFGVTFLYSALTTVPQIWLGIMHYK